MSKIVTLDAGHYGKYNRSPVVPIYYESDMTWSLCCLLAEELEKYGITVRTTRPDKDKDLDLYTRGFAAKGSDLFISIHSNACGDPIVDYPLACCMVDDKTTSVDDRSCDIGLKLAQTVASVMGTKQAGRILRKVGTGGKDYYGVLRGARAAGVPGVLLEHSFHTNKSAANWLLLTGNLGKLAQSEAKVIAEWLGVADNRTAPAEDKPAAFSPYLVKINCTSLNIRTGAGVLTKKTGYIVKRGEVYTIVEERSGWGKLKSGAGWISLAYTVRV